LIRLADGSMSKEVATNTNRLNVLYEDINQLKKLADELVLERIKESDMTIKECSIHARGRYINLAVDTELLSMMARKTKTFEDLLETSTVFLHHRKDETYITLFVREYSKPENNIEWREWFLYLTYKDPWYLHISRAIEQLTLSKIFESAPEEAIIETIDFCFKKSSLSFKTMAFVLSKANLPIKTWETIRDKSTKKKLEEIKRIAEEKINKYQT